MPRIKIIHSSSTPTVRLNVNGEAFSFPATGESDVPDRFIGALTDSGVEFEIVDSGDGAGEEGDGAVGGLGDAPSNIPLPEQGAQVGIDVEQPEFKGTEAHPEEQQPHEPQAEHAEEIAQNADLAILDETVENATAKLDQLDKDRLAALRTAEENGKSRVTMLAAIDAAIAALDAPQT